MSDVRYALYKNFMGKGPQILICLDNIGPLHSLYFDFFEEAEQFAQDFIKII